MQNKYLPLHKHAAIAIQSNSSINSTQRTRFDVNNCPCMYGFILLDCVLCLKPVVLLQTHGFRVISHCFRKLGSILRQAMPTGDNQVGILMGTVLGDVGSFTIQNRIFKKTKFRKGSALATISQRTIPKL